MKPARSRPANSARAAIMKNMKDTQNVPPLAIEDALSALREAAAELAETRPYPREFSEAEHAAEHIGRIYRQGEAVAGVRTQGGRFALLTLQNDEDEPDRWEWT